MCCAKVCALVLKLRIRYHVAVGEAIVADPLAKAMMSREGQVDAMVKHIAALLSSLPATHCGHRFFDAYVR
jgi:hypothetical protein